MRTVFILCFVLLVALAPSARPQSISEFHEQIASSVSEKNYDAALAGLNQLRQAEPKIFEKNNYDYLLARLLDRTGDLAAAMAAYQSVASRGSILKPYALWHISQIARGSGNLILERMYLRELAAAAPDSRLRPAAENRLARSFFESGDLESVVSLLKKSVSPAVNVKPAGEFSISRENQVLLGRSLLKLGRTEEARNVFSKLLDQMPNSAQPDDHALAAAEGLDEIDRTSAAKLSDLEHLRRASIYQFNRSFDKAREHYRAIINDYPASGITPDATYQIGRGFAQQGEVGEAVNWYERVLEQFADHPVAKDALLQAASSYARLSKYKEAVARYKRFIEKYPDDERIDRAYLNIIDVLRDQGEENEAQAWSARTQEVFRGKLPEALALFSSARILIARTDWASALAALDKLSTMPDLGGTRVPSGTNTAEVSFLRAFTLEQLGRYPEAVDAYLSIPDGRGEYYGWRATERLRLLAVDANAKGAIDQKTLALVGAIRSKDPETTRRNLQSVIRLTASDDARREYLSTLQNIYKSLPAYNKIPSLTESQIGRPKPLDADSPAGGSIGSELYFLGSCDEAAPELEAAAKQQNSPVSYSLAKCYLEGDIANKAVAFIEPLWRNVPADYQVELIPHDQLEMLYPAPYRGSLLKYAPARNIDPRFVLSIMPQESRYRADIKSYAAARGLMQFISSTANVIAAKLNTKNFTQDDLYDPATAIIFGSQYLADLFAAFPDQPAAVAVSYNGGDDNMRRWLLRSRSNSPDRYVPEIAFSQSKDYVYKVMANYRVYQFLYDEDLKRKD